MFTVSITFKEYRIPKPKFFQSHRQTQKRRSLEVAASKVTPAVETPVTVTVSTLAAKREVIMFPGPEAYIPVDGLTYSNHLAADRAVEDILIDIQDINCAAQLLFIVLADTEMRFPGHFLPLDEPKLLEILKENPSIYELLKDSYSASSYCQIRRLSAYFHLLRSLPDEDLTPKSDVFSKPLTALACFEHLGFERHKVKPQQRTGRTRRRYRFATRNSWQPHSPAISSPLVRTIDESGDQQPEFSPLF